MHIVFDVLSAWAHFNPTLPVAQELMQRGHQITYVAGKNLEATIRKHGFEIVPSPLGSTKLDELVPERAVLPVEEKGTFDLTEVFVRFVAPKVYKALEPVIETDRPDLIVRDQFAFGGYLVGEKFDIPHAVINITAGWPRSQEFLNGVFKEPINELRAKHNLSPDPELTTFFKYLRLDTAPASLLPGGMPTIATERPYNQFMTANGAKPEALPAWVSEMPHDKTVLVTLGTVWNESNDLYQLIIRAVRDEDVNVIVATGRNAANPLKGDFPPNVRVVEYLPFTALLPHLDAVVFHGGFISLLTMMWAAIPSVAIPIGADHFGNAEAIEQAGAGIGIQPDARSEENIRDALQLVLSDTSYKEAAMRVQADMKTQLSVSEASDLLEQVARTRQPITLS